MCLRRQPIPPVPEDTARVARAAFPDGTTDLTSRDDFGTLFQDEDFAGLYPTRGQPAEAPWRLTLGTIHPFAEPLSDRRATAVRGRIDWAYPPVLDATVLCEFRARLIAGSAEQRFLDAIRDRCRERNRFEVRGRQRTDPSRVRARVQASTRLACVGDTLRHALNSLAVVVPE